MRYVDLTPEQNQPRRVTDLNPHLEPDTETLPLNQRSSSIGDPRSITWHPGGASGWVTGMGSNNIVQVDSSGQRRNAPVEVGQGPTGLIFNEDASLGYIYYVLNRFDATVSVMRDRTALQTLPFFDPTPDFIAEGRPMLYDSHEGSGLGQISCASCHVDGRADRLAWDLGNPAADMTQIGNQQFHPMKGPMRTTSLIGIVGSPNLHFRGDKRDLTEFASTFAGLHGRANAASEDDMLKLEAFIGSIHTPPNPYRNLDNTLPTTVVIPGSDFRVGDATVANNCRQCHGGPNARDGIYRNNSGNMPGGQFSDSQPAIAPSLISMYEIFGLDYDDPTGSTAGFGFIPDGSMDLESGNTLSNNDLVAAMMAFNGDLEFDTHAAVGKQVTINGQSTAVENALLTELFNLAQQRQIGLIAKGLFAGSHAGFVYDPDSGAYQSTLTNNSSTHQQLLNHSGSDENHMLTFTAVPFETRVRIGIDRDSDGEFREWVSAADPGYSATSGNVCYFGNADYSWNVVRGTNFRACTGIRNLTNFGVAKGHSNSISAISVGTGVHTIIFDGTNGAGESMCISSDTDLNSLGSMDDRASSFVVRSGECP